MKLANSCHALIDATSKLAGLDRNRGVPYTSLGVTISTGRQPRSFVGATRTAEDGEPQVQDRDLKLIVVSHNFASSIGWGETLSNLLGKELIALGHEVTVLMSSLTPVLRAVALLDRSPTLFGQSHPGPERGPCHHRVAYYALVLRGPSMSRECFDRLGCRCLLDVSP
jgi:hypothetical protein